jgi:hypothetical protein
MQLQKKRGVRLGPLTKATEDAPGPTLWARCEANQIVAVYIRPRRSITRVCRYDAISNSCQSLCKTKIGHPV